jgi:hypothetical protein
VEIFTTKLTTIIIAVEPNKIVMVFAPFLNFNFKWKATNNRVKIKGIVAGKSFKLS